MGYALNQITALPFGTIIGGPMKAAIEAQALAAKSTIDFIQAVGFKPVDEDADPFFSGTDDGSADIGDVRYVTFKYTVFDEVANTNKLASLEVPILTIVPIPFIRIDEMSIDFMAKISETITNTHTDQDSSDAKASLSAKYGGKWWTPVSIGFNASYSSRHSSSTEANSRYQTEMTMNVRVRAVQDELPAGMSRILNMLETLIKQNPVTTLSKTP
ncbi:MAG: DUF2589 domain-containing protein [Phycisphaerae bacterium]|nr:DUF2589 domain-containing protein [Phycisphaerae bacterium]